MDASLIGGKTMKYVCTANRVNKTATIHAAACGDLGAEPLIQTASAERRGFNDGLDAIAFAKTSGATIVKFCGHCMREWRDIPIL